ncbi:MAG: HD domain-containing phosphohydrolase [Thermoguttaceae bacterium]|jgi:putative nucleotidyltransferase with HDIG domain
MPASDTLAPADNGTVVKSNSIALNSDLRKLLERSFHAGFTIFNGVTGEVLEESPELPACDWSLRGEVCRIVALHGKPEFLDEEDPFIMLALPIPDGKGNCIVAGSIFVTRRIDPAESFERQAALLGLRPEEAVQWALRQTPWAPETLQYICELLLDYVESRQCIKELQEETSNLSVHLTGTYEEISLLYRLTHNLKISKSDEELGQITLKWLEEVLPAKGLALQLIPISDADKSVTHTARNSTILITHGDCPVDNEQFSALMQYLEVENNLRPVVINRLITSREDWPYPAVRQMVVIPMAEGANLFGWLAVFNHLTDAEFGTVEANLLNTVAAILGIHSGNIELYRQQSDLLAGFVRAFTSAIDAKDPYTCGHSDRVARIAVRLAKELGCDEQLLNTLHLSGMLHDIGKIGINDDVLHKPGKLSNEEFQHIKTHVEIGSRILRDLNNLKDVMPVVLHHHESWDGGGYPENLEGERIPLAARIVAVADAYDAMSSDRPYREGMSEEKIEQILHNGAGKQWDPEIIEVFFRAHEDIKKIIQNQSDPMDSLIPLLLESLR